MYFKTNSVIFSRFLHAPTFPSLWSQFLFRVLQSQTSKPLQPNESPHRLHASQFPIRPVSPLLHTAHTRTHTHTHTHDIPRHIPHPLWIKVISNSISFFLQTHTHTHTGSEPPPPHPPQPLVLTLLHQYRWRPTNFPIQIFGKRLRLMHVCVCVCVCVWRSARGEIFY
jgi:hypothetical protein